MAKVVFGLSFELHSEAVVVDVVGGGSGKENTCLFFFWSQWNTGVFISSICVLPWTVMVRCSLSWLLPQVMIHCQVPLCELVTGLSWAVGDHSGESTFGLLHFTSQPSMTPFTSHWSVASLPSRRSAEGVTETDTVSRRWGHSEKHKEREEAMMNKGLDPNSLYTWKTFITSEKDDSLLQPSGKMVTFISALYNTVGQIVQAF